MDRYLLKNIIIIILVLVNGFLLGSLALRQTAALDSRHQVEEHLVALFAADEMSLPADVISRKTPPDPLILSRSIPHEQAVAHFFLGKDAVQEDQGGGTYTYTSSIGMARFRFDGSFDIVGSLATENAEELCQTFCRKFSYSEPTFSSDDTGTAVRLYDHMPVFNCSVTFTLDQGELLTVSGTLLPEEGSASPENQEPLSAIAALTAFQKMCRENGAVVSAVTNLYLCYELQGSTASSLSLVPAWCVVTDTASYYVNCITGVITTS